MVGRGGEARSSLTRDDLAAFLRRAHRALAAHRHELDELNVFPVPDGDTGTNMAGTMAAVTEALDDAGCDADLAATVVRAALRGARGNSGVILSQVLRGFVEHVEGGTAGLAAALEAARERGYAAVSKPVEGTILTAISAAADAAAAASERGDALIDACDAVLQATSDAVQGTTAQLEALREAGVVDAGARGFEVVVAALRRHVAGEDEPAAGHHVARGGPDARRETGSLEFQYEVQYLLEAGDDAVVPLRQALDELGDSVVVVSAGELLSIHVHTNAIGPAIEAGVALGRPSRIEVTRFEDQVAARHAAADAGTTGEGDEVGCVAVLPGPGLRRLAEDHGAVVVDGRAGDLPTVATLADAVARQRARIVVLLPGHPNAVPTARQVAKLVREEHDRAVEVIAEAVGPVQVLSALAVWDPSDPDTVQAATAAARACHTGEVVPATRDATTPIGEVRSGQWLSVVAGEVVEVHDDPLEALTGLAARLRGGIDGPGELATLLIGAGGDRDEAARRVADALDEIELEVVDAGQRPARYVLGIE